jgi:hypothetical protein
MVETVLTCLVVWFGASVLFCALFALVATLVKRHR